MIYLKEFATSLDYENAKNNLPKPNVSLITENGGVKYLKGEPTPPTPVEHEYVDLGLPSGTLWATMNMGANSITDDGLMFQWGDTQGSRPNQREWEDWNYKWYNIETNDYTKYNNTDKKVTLDDEDDAAIASWGDGWHIPSKDQLDELVDNNYTEVSYETNYLNSGVNGLLVTSLENENTIFLPCSSLEGFYNTYHGNEVLEMPGDAPDSAFAYSRCLIFFEDGSITTDDDTYRWYGAFIRPVKDAE